MVYLLALHANVPPRGLQYCARFEPNEARFAENLTWCLHLRKIPRFPNLKKLNSGQRFMYAVIKTGGKQYRVSEGDVIRVEKLPVEEGANIEFGEVLAVGEGEGIKLGAPFIDGGKVTAVVQGAVKGEKIKIVKFRRRKHHQKITGHRQHYTEVKITGIQG